MKNKRLIILLSIFAFLILIVVLSSTVFTVREKSISIEWHSSALTHLKDKDDEIIDAVPTKENVMLMDKKGIVAKLEKTFPYINVLKIEKKFPNKIIVHAIERQDQYAILVGANYYALDDQGKVLNRYSLEEYNALSINKKPIPFEVVGMTIEEDAMQIGKIANISRVLSAMQTLSDALKKSGFTETYQVINNFDSVRLEFGYVSTLTIVNNRNIAIEIDDINNGFSKKLLYGIAISRTDQFKDKTDITLEIGLDSEGKVVVGYPDTP